MREGKREGGREGGIKRWLGRGGGSEVLSGEICS